MSCKYPSCAPSSHYLCGFIFRERFHKDQKDDGTDDIPIIPDIDDLQDDSFNLTDVKKM